MCGQIEDLQRKLFGRESDEEERQVLFEKLNDIKSKVETFKKEAVDEEKLAAEKEKNALNAIINDLQEELEKNKIAKGQEETITMLKQELEKLAEENQRILGSKKNLLDKINDMGLEIARLEKELFLSQEYKHNLDISTSENAYLKNILTQRQEDLEKLSKNSKNLKDQIFEKENRIEDFEKIVRSLENQAKFLNEELADLKKYSNEKDLFIRQDKEEHKKVIDGKDEEIYLLTNQIAGLEKELNFAKKTATAEKSEEFDSLKLEAESLENKISSLNSLLKKQREQNSILTVQLQTSELKNEDLSEQLAVSQEKVANYRAGMSELKLKVENFEELNNDYQQALKTIEQQGLLIDSLKSEILSLKEIIRSLESSKKDKEFYEKQYQSALNDLETANSSKRDLELELVLLSNLKTENSSLTDQIFKLTQNIESIKSQLNDYRNKFSQQESEFDKEREELQHSLSITKKEIAQLERKIKNQEDYLDNELESRHRQIERLSDENKNLSAQNEIYKQETLRLTNSQNALKQQITAKEKEILRISEGKEFQAPNDNLKKFYESQIDEISKNLKNCEHKLNEIIEEKENLRQELALKQNELQAVSEDFAALQNHVYETEKKQSFASPEIGERLNYSPLSDRSLESSARSAQDLIIIESMAPNYSNPLLENVSKLKKEPPMSYKNV